ncbi:hypothetical protein GMSM_29620 [Geomonas sp. Red276]
MTVSRIKDHKVRSGRVISPWNFNLGKTMKLSSWALNRLPEYLWLALILDYYGRERGLELTAAILHDISTYEESLDTPRLSKILSLPVKEQEKIYKSILRNISKEVLSPLTAVIDGEKNEVFWSYFYILKYSLEEKLSKLQSILKDNYFHQSNAATDVRFLVVWNMIYQKRIKFGSDCSATIEALTEYPITSHEDEKMRSYRPMVRASEMQMGESNKEYLERFWRVVCARTECKLFFIEHEDVDMNYDSFLEDTADALDYVWCKSKVEILSNEKLTVMMSLTTYCYKILHEVVTSKMGKSISARSSVRIIAEVFIMLKYLIKMSQEKPNIWSEYQQYGIGKYKLVLLKSREVEVDPDSHVVPGIIEVLVNEETWEEFIDVDLRYFDQMGIREKSIFVDEKELFDLLYDYDSSYAHGLWGAVREAAMVKCENPAHRFHSVPDLSLKQNCSDVIPDMVKLMKRSLMVLSDQYSLPQWFWEKHNYE